jgi:SagB-type dehydrogenase family enzyme
MISTSSNRAQNTESLRLPPPSFMGRVTVEDAFSRRQSTRNYSGEALQLSEISQLAWAAQGITDKDGRRTVPSAGALYPLEIYFASWNVKELPAGVYHYQPGTHSLVTILTGDRRRLLGTAALLQESVFKSSAVMVIAADFSRTSAKYGKRGKRYVYAEAGHAAQNVYLQAVSMQLGTVTIGAFHNGLVKTVLHLPEREEALFLMPLGKIIS